MYLHSITISEFYYYTGSSVYYMMRILLGPICVPIRFGSVDKFT